jgi:hypothetical protein
LNPRPLLCESSDLPLIYVPTEAGEGSPCLSAFEMFRDVSPRARPNPPAFAWNGPGRPPFLRLAFPHDRVSPSGGTDQAAIDSSAAVEGSLAEGFGVALRGVAPEVPGV